MKNELKFYVSLPLYIFTVCLMWIMALPLVFVFVISFDASDYAWWLLVISIYGIAIALPIIIYPRTMSKIHLNEVGIQKFLFRKSKAQFIRWEEVKDVKILTLPNMYSYVIISDNRINATSFKEVLKSKNIIYFTYNKKAIDFINSKLENKGIQL